MFVVLFVCLLAFACTIVCVFFHIIENNHLAVVTFSPCFVSFCFDLVMTKLVLLHFSSHGITPYLRDFTILAKIISQVRAF